MTSDKRISGCAINGEARRLRGAGNLRIVKRKHPWRHVSAVLALAVLGGVVWSLVNNPNIGIDIVLEYLTAEIILKGVLVTIYLTVLSMIFGVAGAIVVAVARQDPGGQQRRFRRDFRLGPDGAGCTEIH